MKKIITFTIMAIAAFSWFVTYSAKQSEEIIPVNTPFIIKSNLPGTCRVSVIPATADSGKNEPIIACKVQLYTGYLY
ncbi:hypothetical protein [Pantoea agglomerans]|uniref:hypothetical protein n=1 Tax=Enterobacter agglomerans TaxID=549 RepID=UPI0010C1A2EA|nr:hypothetical protein [Pantoea agglomerans]TKK15547.1 hypothetical protein PagCFBP13516_19630 [Pantoea agglomerans]